jgi:hypothetical protein
LKREPSTERYRDRICKFCRRAVRFDTYTSRVIEIIGDQPHSPNCPRRQEHFKAQAAIRVQRQREQRNG